MSATSAMSGTVKWFDKDRGYGFITRDDGGEDLFVHYSDIDGKGFRLLEKGQRVQFQEGRGAKGPKATTVRVIEN